eukprot:7390560-Prymnesium_polylepis.1
MMWARLSVLAVPPSSSRHLFVSHCHSGHPPATDASVASVAGILRCFHPVGAGASTHQWTAMRRSGGRSFRTCSRRSWASTKFASRRS